MAVLNVLATLAIFVALGCGVVWFSDKPLILAALVILSLIVIVAFWIPRLKRKDRTPSDSAWHE
ncbi:MAG: hypothetical protein AAF351_15445 [Pseudomonadota bacterium]